MKKVNVDSFRLKAILEKKEITGYRLAKDCSIAQSNVVRILRDNPSITTKIWYTICNYLQIDPITYEPLSDNDIAIVTYKGKSYKVTLSELYLMGFDINKQYAEIESVK